MSLRYSSLGRSAVPPLASLWSATPPAPHGVSPPHGDPSQARSPGDLLPSKAGPMYFTPEELASQMTLLDIQLFKTITPDEVIR
jgi:hypothetical protein